MTHLQAGDRVVCINDAPMWVEVGGAYFECESGLQRGAVYTVDAVLPLPPHMLARRAPPTGAYVKIKDVVSPLVSVGAPDGYHPARFRKAITTGSSSAIRALKRAVGVSDREPEAA